jgi:hypothetical protein
MVAALLISITSKAQKSADNTSRDNEKRNNYDISQIEQGKQVERMQMNTNGKVIKVKFVDSKMTELYVNGQKIPAADWGKYDNDLAAIREQKQRNQEQARLNEIQAKKNQEQEKLNAIQEKKNAEQAVRNREQESLNAIQEKKNAEQALRNQEQERLNAIQEKKNAEQAMRNQEQERLNAIQEKKNAEQAAENERMMNQLTTDLVTDKIIPNDKSLRTLTFRDGAMIVNGVKQSDSIYKKYIEKYSRISKGGFSYSRDGIYNGK